MAVKTIKESNRTYITGYNYDGYIYYKRGDSFYRVKDGTYPIESAAGNEIDKHSYDTARLNGDKDKYPFIKESKNKENENMAVKKLHEGLSFDSAKFKKNCAEIRSKIADLIEADEWDYMDDLSDADMNLVEEEIRDIMGLCRSFLDDFGLTESKKRKTEALKTKYEIDVTAVAKNDVTNQRYFTGTGISSDPKDAKLYDSEEDAKADFKKVPKRANGCDIRDVRVAKRFAKNEAIDQSERKAIMDELVDFIKDCGVKVLKVNYKFGDIEVPREDLKDISSTVEVEFPETRRLDIHIVSASPLGKKFGKMLLPK